MQNIIKKRKSDMKIVAIGGGTGLSVLLRGLKKITTNITAVVSVADDGGGSGILREDLGMLPPGDIRNCILALANTEPIMESLIKYRFTEGRLQGQSFGNLLIAAMTGITGSFENAVSRISDIVAITGRVLPVTIQEMNLVAELESGDLVEGESTIPKVAFQKNEKIKKIFVKEQDVNALDDVIKAIIETDIVLIAAGSLYTSIIANFLVNGITDAIKKSNAITVYVSNLMTQAGETGGYSFLDHTTELIKYVGMDCIDYIIANNHPIEGNILTKYKLKGAEPIYATEEDRRMLRDYNIKLYEDDFIEIAYDYVRHDCDKIAQLLVKIWGENKCHLHQKLKMN